MATYRFIGYGITNNNGIATLDYDADGNPLRNSGLLGTGVGEVDVVASLDDPSSISDSTLQSETYALIDCVVRDGGKASDYNDSIWQTSQVLNVDRTTSSDYTIISETGTTSATRYLKINNTTNISLEKCVIEWHNHLTNNNNNYVIFKGTTDIPTPFERRNISGDCIIRIEVDGTTVKWFKDGVQQGTDLTINRDANDMFTFRFQLNDNASPFGYSDFKVYPI